ncbi:hypothetical protein [Methylocaldum sp.]|uniref:hypothetical protein n=1 Tax=Methylocaldum sp. TaxID=1969727 RepID=UPI002D4806E4|nr:hypothetical protein [Methylocaldum sp.]HYE35469.1 hypothetical protein [Methylocaldum sp.]
MTTLNDRLQMARIKMIRYRVLKTLEAGYPYPVGDGLLADVLTDADLQASQGDVRKALTYLSDKGYIELTEGREFWEGKLLPKGIDYLENPTMEDVGITRPACG